MAFSAGYDATLSVGGTDISQYVKEVKFLPSRKDYPLPVLGGAAVRRIVGPTATQLDLNGFLDSALATVFTAHMGEATPTSAAVVYRPQGATGPTRTCNAFVVKYDEQTPSEGPATWTATLVVDGAVTYS